MMELSVIAFLMKTVWHYFLEFSSINVSTWIDINIFFLNFGNYLRFACKGVDFFPFTRPSELE